MSIEESLRSLQKNIRSMMVWELQETSDNYITTLGIEALENIAKIKAEISEIFPDPWGSEAIEESKQREFNF